MNAVVFWWPAYRFLGVLLLLTAVLCWAAAIWLIPVIPRIWRCENRGHWPKESPNDADRTGKRPFARSSADSHDRSLYS